MHRSKRFHFPAIVILYFLSSSTVWGGDPPACGCADGKPTRLTFQYGDNLCPGTYSNGTTKHECTPYAPEYLGGPVEITQFGQDAGKFVVTPSRGIEIGDSVTVTNAIVGNRLDWYFNIDITNGAVVLAQSLEIHTSCSSPLSVGDQFGSMQLVEFIPEGGSDACASPPPVTDADDDGVLDDNDACLATAANDLVDGFGCSQAQVDSDGDGVCNEDAPASGPAPGCMGSDACPNTPQGEAVNADGCSDTQFDTDNDGVTDAEDNCPLDGNPNQEDNDTDDIGDVCDLDDDNDTVDDVADNCPFDANTDQANADGDGLGDVCDPDDDNDNVLDGDDNCPIDANQDQANNDGDGEGDVCDGDDDNDNVADGDDNCPLDANTTQDDADNDGLGDVCDPDDDSDLVADGDDVCPATAIPEAVPTSSRGLGRNRWTLADTDGSFTQAPPQAGSTFAFTTADTRGCSCEQIIDAAGLGKGHRKRGCSTGAMLEWISGDDDGDSDSDSDSDKKKKKKKKKKK